MKKIPKIFKPSLDKKINNNKKSYFSYLNDEVAINNVKENPIETINRLINDGGYIFNKKLIIITSDRTLHTRIAGKVSDKLITLDGECININDIVNIYEE